MVKFTVMQRLGQTVRVTVPHDVAVPPQGWAIVARVREGEAFVETAWRPETLGSPPVSYFSNVVSEQRAFD